METTLPRLWEPTLAEFSRDPYPLYDAVRGPQPVRWRRSSELEGWAILDYPTVTAALWNPDLSSEGTLVRRFDPEREPMARLVQRWTLFQDAPRHEELRRPLQAALGRAWAAGLQERVDLLAAELVQAAREKGEFDLIADLAVPLPVTVIADVLGMPAADRPLARRWADRLVEFLGPDEPSPEADARADEAAAEMREYFDHLWEKARQDPGPNLLGCLATWQDPPLPKEDLVANCAQLLFAGHETTIHLIGNAVLALLRHPEALEALRAHPDKRERAVEELIRFDPPVQLVNRVATRPMRLGNSEVKAGDFVFLLLGAANRDPQRFPEPHRLDFDRADLRHVSFGNGRHFCLGAIMARAETAAVLSGLLGSGTVECLTPEPPWRPVDFFRGFTSLRLRVQP